MLLAGTLLIGILAVGGTGPAAAQAGAGRLVAVQPCRLVDTRIGYGFTRLDANTIRVSAAGRCGVDAAASAVALSLVSVGSQVPGVVTVFPSGVGRPTASNLNYTAGQIRANAAVVQVAAGASFDVFTVSGDLVVDVTGYFSPTATATAGRFVPVAPDRLYDSRNILPAPHGRGTVVTVPLPAGVPADATAVALNVTITESLGAGFVTAFPAGTAPPEASSLNVDGPGQTRAAGGIYPVSAGGVSFLLSRGGHLLVDISGYFTGPSAAASSVGLFTPVVPGRLLDTRTSTMISATGSVGIAAPYPGPAALNLTSVDGAPGFVTAYATGGTRPGVSNLNPGGGDIVANFSIVNPAAGGITFYSMAATHLVVDVAGWFSASGGTPPPSTTAPPTTSTTTTTTTTVPKPIVYLTFDDGPDPTWTNQLLNVLDQHPSVKVTFFVMGQQVAAHPALVDRARDAGHRIGNHTWNHPVLSNPAPSPHPTLTDNQVIDQMDSTGQEIHDATGIYPTCMRPPQGQIAGREALMGQLGLVIEQGTPDRDGGDWDNDNQPSVQQIVDLLNQARNGDIYTFHDGGGNRQNTVQAISQWLSANAANYDLRALASCGGRSTLRGPN